MGTLLITAYIIVATIMLVLFCHAIDELFIKFSSRSWYIKLAVCSAILVMSYLWPITLSIIIFNEAFTKEVQ